MTVSDHNMVQSRPVMQAKGWAINPPSAPTVWYDFTDKSTLFQDSAGTLPVVNDGDKIRNVTNKGSQSGLDLGDDAGNTNQNGCIYRVDRGAPVTGDGIANSWSAGEFQRLLKNQLASAATFDDDTISITNAMVIMRHPAVDNTGTGWILRTASREICRFALNGGNCDIEGRVGKSEQVGAYTNDGVGAAWALNTATATTCSHSDVNDTDTYAQAAGTGGTGIIQVGDTATQSPDLEIFEILIWQTLVPTAAQMEAYATAKYGITWAAA